MQLVYIWHLYKLDNIVRTNKTKVIKPQTFGRELVVAPFIILLSFSAMTMQITCDRNS